MIKNYINYIFLLNNTIRSIMHKEPELFKLVHCTALAFTIEKDN